jgi:hypothetical protein
VGYEFSWRIGFVFPWIRCKIGMSMSSMSLRAMLTPVQNVAFERPLANVPNLSAEDRNLLENVIAAVYALVDGTPAPAPRTPSVESAFVDYDASVVDSDSARRFHVLVFRIRLKGADGSGESPRCVFTLNKSVVDGICAVNDMRVSDVSLRIFCKGSPETYHASLVVYVLKSSEPLVISSCDVLRVRQKRRFFGD